jgi:hypothetical protein
MSGIRLLTGVFVFAVLANVGILFHALFDPDSL